MFEEVIVEQNTHWQDISYDAGVKRSVFEKAVSFLDNDFILSICGVRRGGKSTLLKQIINHLVEVKEVKPGNILFLNLEDPVFNYYKDDVRYLEHVYQDYLKLKSPEGRLYIFLDEVQFFKDWQVFVKSKYEKKGVKFIVTGSNSLLLSSDMATLLSGRTLGIDIYPFSFPEVLNARGIDGKDAAGVLSLKNTVKQLLDDYLVYGGFPEVIFETAPSIKKEILKNYYQNIFFNDIVPRFEIKKNQFAEKLLYYLLSNVSSQFSYNNLSKVIALADKTVKEYTGYFEQSMILFGVDRFSPSLGKQMTGPRKYYAIDNGLVNAIAFKLSENLGPMFENLIAIDILRKGGKFFYYQTANQKEVDFFIPDDEHKLVQVCYELKHDKTRKREITGLLAVMKETGVNESLLVTLDEEEEIREGRFHIRVLPAWKHLTGI